MAGRGGYRPGAGRKKGQPNKATLEKALIAENVVTEARATGKKLAKEVLDDFMGIFAGMAAYYQPLPAGTVALPGRRRRRPNEAKFENYAKLAVQCAKDLARYQSPTYQAIMVAPAPDQNQPEMRKRFQLTIFENPRAELSAPVGAPTTDAKH
jgi:hypothetical protein